MRQKSNESRPRGAVKTPIPFELLPVPRSPDSDTGDLRSCRHEIIDDGEQTVGSVQTRKSRHRLIGDNKMMVEILDVNEVRQVVDYGSEEGLLSISCGYLSDNRAQCFCDLDGSKIACYCGCPGRIPRLRPPDRRIRTLT